MFGIGRLEELLVIFAIVFLLFGGKKLPELSRGLGRAIKDIRNGFTDDVNESKVEPDLNIAQNEEVTPVYKNDIVNSRPVQPPLMEKE